jgi:hypothetical protein
MKKITFIIGLVAAILVSGNMEAQERKSGIRAGYLRSATELSWTRALDGFYVGFSHDRPIGQSQFLYVHGGTEYTQTGWEITDNTFHRLY